MVSGGNAATQLAAAAAARPGSSIEGGMDDTRIDLSQLDPSAGPSSVSIAPEAAAAAVSQLMATASGSSEALNVVATTENDAAAAAAASQVIADDEAIAGPSGAMVVDIVEIIKNG